MKQEFVQKGMFALRDPETGVFQKSICVYVTAEDAKVFQKQHEEAVQGLAEMIAEEYLKQKRRMEL